MINIDPRLRKPIFQQIVDNIKENILKGSLVPGEKIPSIREMALLLETNPNTISKAYKELEREKIIEVIIGRGTFIANNFKATPDKEKTNEISKTLKKLIIDSKYIGINKTEFIQIINDVYSSLDGEKND